MGPPSGISVHGICQARIQDWVAIPSSRGSSPHRDRIQVSCLAAAAAKSLQSCLTLRPHRWQPTRLPCSWDSPGKNSGVGCHFLLQCIKAKSESEVAQSCQTLSDPRTAAFQAPLSMGFSRQEYWSGLPFPSPMLSIDKEISI